MNRVCVLVIAAMASLCGHQARADLSLSVPSLRPKPGEQVSVECTVSTGEVFRGWFRKQSGGGFTQVPQSSSASVRVEANSQVYTLKFTNVEVSQGGEYECRGSLNNKESFTLEVAYDVSLVKHVQHIKIGQTDTIELGIRGYPKPSFTWKKDKKQLNPSSDPHYTLLDDGSLRVNIVRIGDQGNYSYTVKQSGYEITEDIEVYAVELPKILPIKAPRRYVTEGYATSFVCEATGSPPPKYTWLSPSGQVISTIGNNWVKGGNLTFLKVSPTLKGKYTCKAHNEIEKNKEKIGEAEAVVEIIGVYVAPKITSQGGDEELTRGDNFKLECKATGTPTPDVQWKRNGDYDPRQTRSKGLSIIELKNVQIGDGGRYTCEASNKAIDSSGNAIVTTMVRNIYIKSAPYVNKPASPDQIYSYIGNGDPTFVSCTFGGYPHPWVIMTFNKKLMSNATTTANVSVITDAKRKFGNYICHAKNEFGFKNQTVELKEVGKPTEVRDISATSTCDSIKLNWKPPADDGGMPITKYVLDYLDVRRNVDGKETSYTIRELERNTLYIIQIRATNKGEWGPISKKEARTKEFCAPGPPIIYQPKGTILDDTSFTLKWQRPDDTGGDDNIEYIVRYRDETEPDEPGPWKDFKTKELEYDVKDLDKGKKYKFEVIAKNEGGESSPAERLFEISILAARSSQSPLVASVLVTFIVGTLHL